DLGRGRAESRPALLIVPRCARGNGKLSHRIRMNQKELKELIEFLIEKDIAEFELERGDVKVRIKRAAEPGAHPRTEAHYFAVHPAPPAAPDVGRGPVPGASGLACRTFGCSGAYSRRVAPHGEISHRRHFLRSP